MTRNVNASEFSGSRMSTSVVEKTKKMLSSFDQNTRLPITVFSRQSRVQAGVERFTRYDVAECSALGCGFDEEQLKDIGPEEYDRAVSIPADCKIHNASELIAESWLGYSYSAEVEVIMGFDCRPVAFNLLVVDHARTAVDRYLRRRSAGLPPYGIAFVIYE